MKAISDLNRIRGAGRCTLSIDAATIAADHLDGPALLEPMPEFIGGPAWQQIDHAMPVQIDEDGPVGLSFSPGPIVNAEMSDGLRFLRRFHTVLDRPDDCVIADCDGQPIQDSAARQASCGMTNQPNDFSQPGCTATKCANNIR